MALAVERVALHLPSLTELAQVLQEGLAANFSNAEVTVEACPDLSQLPWGLAAPGICGSPQLADVGGVPYLFPVAQKDKKYDLSNVATSVGLPAALVIGAGAGSSQFVGVNCELIPNLWVSMDAEQQVNRSYAVRTVPDGGSHELFAYPCTECGPLANVLVSQGLSGKVLCVKARGRTGADNFVTCMRKALAVRYEDNPVGIGGVFQILSGKAKLHVMAVLCGSSRPLLHWTGYCLPNKPDFSPTPITTDKEVGMWLQFFEMSAPLVCCSTFISHDPGLDLRVEHTHCFSHHGDGGHYHYDTTPQEVEYLGYFVPAESLHRIDRPKQTHTFGRD